MKVISKRISRNEFISRKNGVIPSLVDMWVIPETQLNCGGSESYVFGTYESAAAKIRELGLSPSLLEYKAEFVYQDHNYGLIVSDVIIPNNIAKNITDYTDIYVNIPNTENGGYYDLNDRKSRYHYEGRKIMDGGSEVKILTYATLNKWYTFFKSYKKIIKTYDNAIGLYNAEFEPKNEVNQKRFSDIDDLFEARGGNAMYNWIIDYCMPHDANKEPKSEVSYMTNSASYVIPILITNSIDDLGEMTMFSSKWKAGTDYHNRVGEGLGTVVDRPYSYDSGTTYETYVIKSNTAKGYEQNEYYENEFNKEDWSDYTDWYVKENKYDFSSYDSEADCVSTYAYSHDGKVLYNPTGDCETINYIKQEYILANGEYIEVIDGEYVIPNYSSSFVREMKLPVITDGSMKYAELNGKRFYALSDGNTKKIYFTKLSNCYDQGSPIIKSKYIIYNGNLIPFTGNMVVINNDDEIYTFTVFNGRFTYKGIMFYIVNDKVVLPIIDFQYSDDTHENGKTSVNFKEIGEDDLRKLGWESVSVDAENGTVNICYKLNIKHSDMITGYTDSKLDLLRRRKINADELGNELPGYLDLEFKSTFDGYDVYVENVDAPEECAEGITVQFGASDKVNVTGSHYNTPYDQCTLDILYKVGEVSGLEYQTTVKNEEDEYVELFHGNYIESIEFYQLDDNGEKINSEFVSGEDSRPYLAKYDENGEYYDPGKVLFCDITYHIGATLVFDSTTSKYKQAEDRHEGVKYIDTLTVVKTTGDFYMSDNSFFTFIYYELRGNMSDEHLDDFRDNQLTNMSYFEMKIKLYDGACYEENLFETDYWENNNGMIVSPVFRTEYNLFSSMPQNTESDIYIDRGINAAFERHIKLQEIHNLNALENYGNGYFKIIDS